MLIAKYFINNVKIVILKIQESIIMILKFNHLVYCDLSIIHQKNKQT